MGSAYCAIDEEAAYRAMEMSGCSRYVPGAATAAYRQHADLAAATARFQKKRAGPEHHRRIDYLLGLYVCKLAENINESYAIVVNPPSGIRAEPARFLKGVSYARERNAAEWLCIQALLDRIRRTGVTSENDVGSIPSLEKRLEERMELQGTMKAANAYYRSHGTLEGCPCLPREHVRMLEADMAAGYHMEDQPFTEFQILDNDAEIRLVRERIRAQEMDCYTGWEFEGGEVEADPEAGQLRVLFDGMPDESVRAALKQNGFRWAPKARAWQRKLDGDAIRAADSIEAICPICGEKPSDLQHSEEKRRN